MKKSFVLIDNKNNLEKIASVIVRFSYEEKDYIVYSVEENELNSQIFVSRLILNSEGKYFVDDLLSEEKGKLSNIVYNVVILTPSEAKKGISFETLSSNLFDKFFIKLSLDIPDMEMQEYYSNSSIAITNKALVDTAVEFYDDNLNVVDINDSTSIPIWTAPVDVTSPVETSSELNSVGIQSESNFASTIPVEDAILSDLDLREDYSNELPVSAVQDDFVNDFQTNPQVEKIAIVSDPSLGLGVRQPNVGKRKKAGFANTKYVVIGTVSLLLSVAVIVAAYFLIKNMS